jgi:hypothetical protein
MKGIPKIIKKYLFLFFVLICFSFLAACNGITPTLPVINSFSADPSSIDSGDSSVLSWNVTNATTITIIPGNMTFTYSSGSVAVSPTMNTNYTLTATNAEGSVSSSVPVSVLAIVPVDHTITIQPGPEGKDSYVNPHVVSLLGNGDSATLTIGSSTIEGFRAYLQFDLSSLPTEAVIMAADLKLYQFSGFGVSGFVFPAGLYRVTESWDEDLIKLNNRPDYASSPESTISVTMGDTGWLSWDITDLLQEWLDGSIVNYGVVIKAVNEGIGSNSVDCYSSDYMTSTALRPKLEVTYYVP